MAEAVTTPPAPVLSFPSILRNPGLKDRYAHLHEGPSAGQDQAASTQVRFKKLRRDQNEGKRWVRRKDNAHFVGNPHVVAATRMDYILPTPSNRPTFPEPLPSYLPRTVKVPVAVLPRHDPVSANAGRFSLSMKGMRKELRRAGGRAEALVRDVEGEMVEWLQGGVMLRPDESNAAGLATLQLEVNEGREIGTTGAIKEVSRTPLQLVWSIADDAFARYIVHCCARYHEVVSFSKGDSKGRLTYLLRPNVQQPDYRATATLETPPITDIDYSSQPDTTDVDSDFISDRELIDSDVDEPTLAGPQPTATTAATSTLESIQEGSLIPSPVTTNRMADNLGSLREEDGWSVLSGDADGDESDNGTGQELADSFASLKLVNDYTPAHETHPAPGGQDTDPDKTLTQDATKLVREVLAESNEPRSVRISHHEQPTNLSDRRWIRSSSSPSRSPVRTRRLANKRKRRAANLRTGNMRKHTSFYDYLFL